MREALERFIAAQLAGPENLGAVNVEVCDLEPIYSVGNARRPWSFNARWRRNGDLYEIACVMLVKAEAGQLETQMPVEFSTMRALHNRGVPIPRVLWLDEAGEAFGSPFFVSERVRGTADMSILRVSPDDRRGHRLAEDMVRAIVALHAIRWADLGLELAVVTARSAAGAQLDYWEDIFERQRLEPLPAVAFAFAWLRDHQPVAERVVVVHGDFRVGNILYDGDRVTALLDWEMVHLGDPLEDIAWAYRPLWSMQRHMSLGEFVDRYMALSGTHVDPDCLLWYRLFNEVKHAMISLTAARSFNDGATQFIRHSDRATTIPDFMAQFLEWLP